jgi:hypothetical protein
VVARRMARVSWEDAEVDCGRTTAAKHEEPRENTEAREITELLVIRSMSVASRLWD